MRDHSKKEALMENFLLLGNGLIQMSTGVFAGVESYARYPSGELLGLRLGERNMLVTHVGELVPAYTETARRKSKYSVEFYRNGMLKAASLDEQAEIVSPIGVFPAELVTFYDSGELHRLFPLDGKITGFWSEEDERSLAIPFSFELGFCQFTAIVSGICFYRSGDIRSITLFAGETVDVEAPCGPIAARQGFSLHESGALESLEPNEPTLVQTPIGELEAFDAQAVGLSADRNSLVFDGRGRIASLATTHSKVAVHTETGNQRLFEPSTAKRTYGCAAYAQSMRVSFDYAENTVAFKSAGERGVFSLETCSFHIESTGTSDFVLDCEGCEGCNGQAI
jgi:hypothetical protein